MKNWQFITKPLLVLALLAGSVLVYTTFSLSNSGSSEHRQEARSMSDSGKDWSSFDFTKPKLPLLDEAVKEVEVETKTGTFKGVKTHYLEANAPASVRTSGQNVLLLHGAAFSSKTWLGLGTINLLAAMGHRVIAVDLPGYGQTKATIQSPNSNEEYLKELIKVTGIKNPVIVSPSMSGQFSVPFILKYPQEVSGYIPVAPVNTARIAEQGSNLKIPTLIIYGDLDLGIGLSSYRDLKHIPTSNTVILKNSKHPAYLDQPETFHTLLYNFINAIKPA